jgi:RING finger protein 170
MLDAILAVFLLICLLAAALVIAYVVYRIATYPTANSTDETTPHPTPSIRGDDSTCSICLDAPTDAIITNCGHVYCASCLLQAFTHSDTSSLSCPTCRRPVTLMMPRHSIQDVSVREQVHGFNRRYGTFPCVRLPHLLVCLQQLLLQGPAPETSASSCVTRQRLCGNCFTR